MCHFDTGILPYNWVCDHNNPTPNANTMHVCVDWKRLQEWLKSRAVEVPRGLCLEAARGCGEFGVESLRQKDQENGQICDFLS
jgi:hypothetical protein